MSNNYEKQAAGINGLGVDDRFPWQGAFAPSGSWQLPNLSAQQQQPNIFQQQLNAPAAKADVSGIQQAMQKFKKMGADMDDVKFRNLMAKYAEQDNSTDSRSAVGEGKVTYKTNADDHATGTDAWDSLDSYMKSANEMFNVPPGVKLANEKLVSQYVSSGMDERAAIRKAYPDWSDTQVDAFLSTYHKRGSDSGEFSEYFQALPQEKKASFYEFMKNEETPAQAIEAWCEKEGLDKHEVWEKVAIWGLLGRGAMQVGKWGLRGLGAAKAAPGALVRHTAKTVGQAPGAFAKGYSRAAAQGAGFGSRMTRGGKGAWQHMKNNPFFGRAGTGGTGMRGLLTAAPMTAFGLSMMGGGGGAAATQPGGAFGGQGYGAGGPIGFGTGGGHGIAPWQQHQQAPGHAPAPLLKSSGEKRANLLRNLIQALRSTSFPAYNKPRVIEALRSYGKKPRWKGQARYGGHSADTGLTKAPLPKIEKQANPRRALAGLAGTLAAIPVGAGLGAGVLSGAVEPRTWGAEKGKRLQGAGRGAVVGTGTGVGAMLGGGLGTVLAALSLIPRGRQLKQLRKLQQEGGKIVGYDTGRIKRRLGTGLFGGVLGGALTGSKGTQALTGFKPSEAQLAEMKGRPLTTIAFNPTSRKEACDKTGLTPYQLSFAMRVHGANLSPQQIEAGIEKAGEYMGEEYVEELREGMDKIASMDKEALGWLRHLAKAKPLFKNFTGTMNKLFTRGNPYKGAKPALSSTGEKALRLAGPKPSTALSTTVKPPPGKGLGIFGGEGKGVGAGAMGLGRMALGAGTGVQAVGEDAPGWMKALGAVGGAAFGRSMPRLNASAQAAGNRALWGGMGGGSADYFAGLGGIDTGGRLGQLGALGGFASPLLRGQKIPGRIPGIGGKALPALDAGGATTRAIASKISPGVQRNLGRAAWMPAAAVGFGAPIVGGAIDSAKGYAEGLADETSKRRVAEIMSDPKIQQALQMAEQGSGFMKGLEGVGGIVDPLLEMLGMDPSKMNPLMKILLMAGGGLGIGGLLSGSKGAGIGGLGMMAIPLIMQAMKGQGANPSVPGMLGPGGTRGVQGNFIDQLTPDERARFEAEQRAQAASDPNQVALGLAGGNPSTKTEMEKARG